MEKIPTNGLENKPIRERALDAYKKFITAGTANPDNLDINDPEVKEANKLFDEWQQEVDMEAGDDEEKKIRANLAKTMFYVDAGFTDPDYLDEVLRDWLAQDSQSAEKESDNLERAITRQKIADAMKKIRGVVKP